MDTSTPRAAPPGHIASRPRLFYGWVVAAAAFWVDFLGYGVPTVALGVFLPVMADSLGWGRGPLAAGLLLQAALVAAVSPALGVAVDRRGPRLLVAGGGLLLGGGAALLALVQSAWQFYLVFGLVMGLGAAGLSDVVNHATVARWFLRQRGRALGLATMGYSAAGLLLPLPLAALIDRAGWRAAWVALGAATGLLALLAGLLLRRAPEDLGLNPDGDDAPPQATAAPSSSESARAALRTSAFWLLLGGSTAAGLALYGINVHLVAYLADRGLSLARAATVVTVLYGFQWLAKPLWGLAAERLPVRHCLALCYGGGALGVLLLLGARSLPTALPFIVVYGLTRGAQSLLVSLAWATYFGRDVQGRVRGLAATFRVLSVAGGPIRAGALYDRTGRYAAAFVIFAALFAVGGLVSAAARPPRASRLPAPR